MHTVYDPEYAQRFWRVLLRVDRVFKHFRIGFLGKVSPVHMFWESFDMAVTRFSGRRAPQHPDGVPSLPDAVTREAYSHEVSSAGFWPGGGGVNDPAFYSYAYPTPAGFDSAPVQPRDAFYHKKLGEFILRTMPCATPKRRMRCYWSFHKAPMKPRLKPVAGTERRSSVCWANPVLVPEIPGKT
jgi:hypothetical protein